MASFWEHVNKVLREADIIIEVLDARMVEGTRNIEVEEKVKSNGKKIIYAINKCDLVDKKEMEKIKKKLKHSVFISSTKHLGTTMLKKKIMQLSHGENVVVGIVGYPNVGKSSLINALGGGRSTARTSPESGFTKGIQKIRVGTKIHLLDTPGVLPGKEKDDLKHGKIGALSYGKIKDAESVVLKIIEENKELFKKYYSVEGDDAEEILDNVAIKTKMLLTKARPNTDAASRRILMLWQKGEIK